MKQQTFDEKMKLALTAKSPTFEIPENMRKSMHFALQFASPMTLGISGSEMKVLATKLVAGDDLNCYEYAVASNNLELRTVRELESNMPEYLDLMVDIEKFGIQFNQDTLDIRNEVIASMAKDNIRPIK